MTSKVLIYWKSNDSASKREWQCAYWVNCNGMRNKEMKDEGQAKGEECGYYEGKKKTITFKEKWY